MDGYMCTTYGCLNNSDKTTYGYWTASPAATSTRAWRVYSLGAVNGSIVSSSGYYGVRPVIEVLKSQLG